MGNRQAKARELVLGDSIDSNNYRTIKKECEVGIVKAEQQLSGITAIANIEPLIDKSIKFLEHIDILYLNGNSKTKNNIIGSMFPEKSAFDGEHFRTTRINEAVKLIYSVGEAFSQKERGQKQEFPALSSLG